MTETPTREEARCIRRAGIRNMLRLLAAECQDPTRHPTSIGEAALDELEHKVSSMVRAAAARAAANGRRTIKPQDF